MKFKTALFASMLLVAGSAVAAEDSGFYVGAGIGYGKINVNENKLDNIIQGELDGYNFDNETALAIRKSSVGQGATPYSLTVGYRFNKYFATELSYIDLGNADYKAKIADYTVPTAPVDVGSVKAQWDAKGWPLTVLGIWPIDDAWEVFGKVGLFMGDVKLDGKAKYFDGDLIVRGHESANSNEFIGGVGVNYNFMETWAARLEWQALPSLGNNKTGDGNWNNIQASIFYKF
jgi:OOP family OmpA-OmpF porin